MKKQKEIHTSRGSVIFYVIAVIFLLCAVFSIYQAYSVIQYNKAQYPLKMTDIVNVYVQGCLPSFAYACIAYGIGVVVNKIHEVNRSLSLCISEAVEVEENDDHKEAIHDSMAEVNSDVQEKEEKQEEANK